MAATDEYKDFECDETEEEIVQELAKLKIYENETTLDGMVDAAKKNLHETLARLASLKTSLESEGKTRK